MAKKLSQLDTLSPIQPNAYVLLAYNGNNYKVTLGNLGEGIDKASLGLDKVNNTSDLEKPISTATQSALSNKSNINHGHGITDVSGLLEALLSKADVTHNHSITSVDGLTEELAGKALVTHLHTLSQITGLIDALNSKANSVHNHSKSEISGLTNDLVALQNSIASKADALHIHTADSINGLTEFINQTVGSSGDITVGVPEW